MATEQSSMDAEALRESAWAHRDAFDCEPTNPTFARYVERSLAKIVAAHSLAARARLRGTLKARAGGKRRRR